MKNILKTLWVLVSVPVTVGTIGVFAVILFAAVVETVKGPSDKSLLPQTVNTNTALPSPTTKPQVKSATSQRESSDPIVNCRSSEECGGGIIGQMKNSKCQLLTCCPVGGVWQIASSENECDKAQPSISTNQGGSTGAGNKKKVTFTTTEATVDGTYQCYEDRVNELTRMENELKMMGAGAETCSMFKQIEVDKCVNECPVSGTDWVPEWNTCMKTCFKKLDECLTKSKAAGDKRKEYMNLISQICP